MTVVCWDTDGVDSTEVDLVDNVTAGVGDTSTLCGWVTFVSSSRTPRGEGVGTEGAEEVDTGGVGVETGGVGVDEVTLGDWWTGLDTGEEVVGVRAGESMQMKNESSRCSILHFRFFCLLTSFNLY